MPYRDEDIEKDHFYHIYNRGNNREKIFFERENYRFFLQKFAEYMPPEKVEIHVLCLMPNHYHFLVRLAEEFDYSKGMNRLGISYAKSVNSWYAREGHLFQGRFNAKHVKSLEYLLHLSRYIHLNPVLARLVKKAEDWEYSSYREYLRTENPEIPCANQREISGFPAQVRTDIILSNFDSTHTYRSFVESIADADKAESRNLDEQFLGEFKILPDKSVS